MAYLLGIGGLSGSGKSTLAKLVVKHLELWDLSCYTLSTDDCYKDLSHYPQEERDAFCFDPGHNFDSPWSLNGDRIVAFAEAMKRGRGFKYNKYDFSRHCYGDETAMVPDGLDVGIIEGIFALYSGPEVGTKGTELVEKYDHRIFVVTSPEIGVTRRVRRDTVERGRETAHVLDQLEKTVIPMQKKHIMPTQQNADDIVNWFTDETQPREEAQAVLLAIARQRALAIYDAVRKAKGEKPLLPEITLDGIEIFPG